MRNQTRYVPATRPKSVLVGSIDHRRFSEATPSLKYNANSVFHYDLALNQTLNPCLPLEKQAQTWSLFVLLSLLFFPLFCQFERRRQRVPF